jgi:hypothetical protein
MFWMDLGGLGLVITNHQCQLAAQHAASGIDVLDRGLDAEHACGAALGRGRRRQVAIEAQLDLLHLGLADAGHHDHGGRGDQRQTAGNR